MFKPDTKSAWEKKRILLSKRTSGERTGNDPEIDTESSLALIASPEETDERVDTAQSFNCVSLMS